MADYGKPPDFEIASLKKREAGFRDLMMPGNGIPWENRGTEGMLMAFLRTCVRSMTRHPLLLDHIRRPETTHEARFFAIMCAIVWSLAALIWDGVLYYLYTSQPTRWDVDGSQYLVESLVQAIFIGLLVFVLMRVSVAVYNKLIAGVVRANSVPLPLTYNVLAYSLGPSLLALVPIVGWIAAAIWIFVDVIIAGSSRLYLRTREAVINACLIAFVVVLITGAAWGGWWLVWGKVMSSHASVEARPVAPLVPSAIRPG